MQKKDRVSMGEKRKEVVEIVAAPGKEETARMLMDPTIPKLGPDITVEEAIEQVRASGVQPKSIRKVFIVGNDGELLGYIDLAELISHDKKTRLSEIMHANEVVVKADEDQEVVARKVLKAGETCAPVVEEGNRFVGVITPEDLVQVIQEEASEDVYRMSAAPEVEHGYFNTPFTTLFFYRVIWLGGLLTLQSVSSFILERYSALTKSFAFLSLFYTMLIGTGGNAGNQSSTLVIRGLATGEINKKTALRLIFRELLVGVLVSTVLFAITVGRVYAASHSLLGTIAVGVSLVAIIMTAVMLGTILPLVLNMLGLDPAYSAAPFLATATDIIGIAMYCWISEKILM